MNNGHTTCSYRCMCEAHARNKRGGGGGAWGQDPLQENHKATRPTKLQRWAIIGPPTKRHLNGISLAGRLWPNFSGIWILCPLFN